MIIVYTGREFVRFNIKKDADNLKSLLPIMEKIG